MLYRLFNNSIQCTCCLNVVFKCLVRTPNSMEVALRFIKYQGFENVPNCLVCIILYATAISNCWTGIPQLWLLKQTLWVLLKNILLGSLKRTLKYQCQNSGACCEVNWYLMHLVLALQSVWYTFNLIFYLTKLLCSVKRSPENDCLKVSDAYLSGCIFHNNTC